MEGQKKGGTSFHTVNEIDINRLLNVFHAQNVLRKKVVHTVSIS